MDLVEVTPRCNSSRMPLANVAFSIWGTREILSRGKKFYQSGQTIWERLDRSLANNEWLVRFGGSSVHHLTCSTSNHSSILILPKILVPVNPKKPFRCEEMWVGDKGCTNTIKTEWYKRGFALDGSGSVLKIEQCGKALKQWSSRNFGCIRKELKLKQKLLAKVELEALTSGINFRARQLKCEVNDLLDKETRMWFERSQALWVTHGDKNCKYFHSRSTQQF